MTSTYPAARAVISGGAPAVMARPAMTIENSPLATKTAPGPALASTGKSPPAPHPVDRGQPFGLLLEMHEISDNLGASEHVDQGMGFILTETYCDF